MLRSLSLVLFTALPTAAVVAPSPAQEPAQKKLPVSTDDLRLGKDVGLDSTKSMDRFLATCLTVQNEKEIALAQIAEQKAQDGEVKEFARRMVADHRDLVTKLARFGPERLDSKNLEGSKSRGDESRDSPKAQEPLSPQQRAESEGERLIDRARDSALPEERQLTVLLELARKCKSTTEKMLSEKQGAEFDHCYMGMAVFDHQAALDSIEVFDRHASAELRTVMQEGKKTVSAHLGHAKELAKRIENSVASSTRKTGE